MKSAPAALALALFVAACAAEPSPAPPPALRVDVTITRPADTIRFQAPGGLFRCDSTSDLLAESVRGTHGILVWLRFRDSLVHEVPIIGVRDTVTRPGAVIAMRYMHEAVPHNVALDSGRVTLHDSGATRRIVVAGTGLDVGFGVRAGLHATFSDLPVSPDSMTSCTRGQ